MQYDCRRIKGGTYMNMIFTNMVLAAAMDHDPTPTLTPIPTLAPDQFIEATYNVSQSFGYTIAAMMARIYSFLYKPTNMSTIFSEFTQYFDMLYEKQSTEFGGLVINVSRFHSTLLVMQAIGIGLLVFGFLVELSDKVSEGDFTINNFWRHLLKFFMLYFVMLYSYDIFKALMDGTTEAFDIINKNIKDNLAPISSGVLTPSKQKLMAIGINHKASITTKLALFIMCLIPYCISAIYTTLCYFFGCSRIIELVVRAVSLPLVVGISYFGHGSNLDAVRFMKRTMGVIFQIVVILVISASLTFVHSSLVSSDTDEGNPIQVLEKVTYDDIKGQRGYIDADGTKIMYTGIPMEPLQPPIEGYTIDSIQKFANLVIGGGENYIVSTGLMLSALILLIKSRGISTALFE